ncbi:MAG: polyprenyl synthetase family protein [Desulfovibrionaceae bacterium]|nr:polyprenyl synthetase family protein [Desulfovibrionaceae bacterium]
MGFKAELAARAGQVDAFLAGCLKGRGFPAGLLEAMEYSLLAGGKRLRPVLTLTWAGLLGLDRESALPFASGLELIHTYSLIHDDLPAMDDDDLRRGRPSNHKKFGEASAILAGDGLLTEAFGLMCASGLARGLPADRVLRATSVLAAAAGAGGMVGGQALDMEYTGRPGLGLDELRTMQAMKTGALITAACLCGAMLSGAGPEDLSRAEAYGRAVGVAFQIVDDILDVVGDQKALGKPVGSDQEKGKSTYPALVGLEESRRLAGVHADRALSSLAPYSGPDAEFLRDLARFIVHRAF